jgi:hypothetical protein
MHVLAADGWLYSSLESSTKPLVAVVLLHKSTLPGDQEELGNVI